MFSYSWETEYAHLNCIFDNGWKRFNKCNAATYEVKHTQTFNDGTSVNIERTYFISYATPIAMIKTVSNVANGKRNYTHIYINMVNWDVSPTTQRQLRRFIDHLAFFHDIGFESDVLLSELRIHSHTTKSSWYIGNNCHVIPMSPHEMIDMFNTQCPYYG